MVFGGLFALLIIIAIVTGGDEKNENVPGTDKSQNAASVGENSSTEQKKASNWEYDTKKDEMSEKNTYYAWATSENTVNFSFPYNGGSQLSICLGHSDQNNKNFAYLHISKGQFAEAFEGGIRVKFDDGKLLNYAVKADMDPAKMDNDNLYIQNTNDFIKKLKSSKKVKLEVSFFDEGYKVFNFDVEGLDWKF